MLASLPVSGNKSAIRIGSSPLFGACNEGPDGAVIDVPGCGCVADGWVGEGLGEVGLVGGRLAICCGEPGRGSDADGADPGDAGAGF